MWPFDKKTCLEESGFLAGFTDWHSHILPGVDDGIRHTEDALAVLDFYEKAGIREVWLTPHIMEEFPNTPADLRKRFAALQEAYKGPMVLHLAAENMMDSLFQERLEAGELLPIGEEGRHLLVETSYFNPPLDLFPLLERIKEKGWVPLLAHPERYVYMGMKEYDRLQEMGVEFQLNLPSLAGAYDPEAAKKAVRLLRKGYYNRAGSDIHRLRAFQWTISRKIAQKDIDLIPKRA